MSIRTSFFIISLWAIHVLGLKRLLDRTASISYNKTSSSETATITSSELSLECCYLSSFEVGQVLWYSEIINITVATVSTIVYQYDNTVLTSIQTLSTSSTVPSKPITRLSIYDLPTTIIGTDLGVYEAETTFIHGTAFTDPYETVYHSPTPVWIYTDIIYATASPTIKNSAYACPSPSDIKSASGDEISPYPSGFFLADEDSNYGWNSPGAISTTLPTQLRDWMLDYAASDTANTLTILDQCKLGVGRGVPTAYIPYSKITATITTTSTILGVYGHSDIPSSTSQIVEVSSSSTAAASSSTSINTTFSQSIQATTVVIPIASITVTKTVDLATFSESSQTSSVQIITAVNAAVLPTVTANAAVITSFVSGSSFTTSRYVVLSSESGTRDEMTIVGGMKTEIKTERKTEMGGKVITTVVSGGKGGEGKIVVVVDWVSGSTGTGEGSTQMQVQMVTGTSTGTGTVQVWADSTVAAGGIVQSSKVSGGGRGRGMGRSLLVACIVGWVGSMLLVWVLGIGFGGL
ncbi:hypothetical protein SBOR_1857 [Sclerotinia borealis F-4128]|uniref:Uncharacterized protein n=1 Tax=Sclerotinia borealis (strain F-4128) TaxID=1432307 RepID=W9CTE6_SCLBF|nr:hypothetical protein SBOR_1857 [Sclerotinia borealis F-4128]